METLAERAALSLAHHPSPALPIEELAEHVRDGGGVVASEVLLRALEARPDLFRVLDPWRGPWRASVAGPGARCAERRASAPDMGAGTRWVVALGGPGEADRSPPARLRARLRASMVQLARTLDERSTTDLARWLGMVRELSRQNPRDTLPRTPLGSASGRSAT